MTALIERETGDLPVSIGTAFALQGLMGTHPTTKNKPRDIELINMLMINVDTVVRNFLSSMTTQQRDSCRIDAATEVVLQEIRLIPQLVRESPALGERVKVQFYQQSLADLKWVYPRARRKEAKTEKQVMLATQTRLICERVVKSLIGEATNKEEKDGVVVYSGSVEFMTYRTTAPSCPRRVAKITHYPHQLINRFIYESLFLLESHTGKLKPHAFFYTKLNGLGTDHILPLDGFTIQIFGDSVLFDGFSSAAKKELLNVASLGHWTQSTAASKEAFDIEKYGSEELVDLYREMTRRLR